MPEELGGKRDMSMSRYRPTGSLEDAAVECLLIPPFDINSGRFTRGDNVCQWPESPRKKPTLFVIF